MVTVRVGRKRKHVKIPNGFRLLPEGYKVIQGDMFCNLLTYTWEHVDDDDIGVDARHFDAVIRRIHER